MCLITFAGCLLCAQDDTTSLQGLLKIEPDSGALNLVFPLGPGLGEQGLRYTPTLTGRLSPLVGLAPLASARDTTDSAPALLTATGFSLAPGILAWQLPPEGDTANPKERTTAEWSYPDGSTSTLGEPLAHLVDPGSILRSFGYAAAPGPDSLPPRPTPQVFQGSRREFLLAMPEEGEQPGLAQGRLPARFLVIRGQLGFEYSYQETRKGQPRFAHYRLTGIRDGVGESVRFTYGANGVDFQATQQGRTVRLTLDGVAPIPPIAALDDARSPLDPGAATLAFRDVVVRLRIVYDGWQSPLAFAVTALARPEFRTPEGVFKGGFSCAPKAGDAIHAGFLNNLQVTAIRREGTGNHFRFRYGKAMETAHPGPNGTQRFSPTVLQELGQGSHTIRMTWEHQPWPPPTLPGATVHPAAGPWRYGISLVEDSLATHKLILRGPQLQIGGQSSGTFSDTLTSPREAPTTFTFGGTLHEKSESKEAVSILGSSSPWASFWLSDQGLAFLLVAGSMEHDAEAKEDPKNRSRAGLKGGMFPGSNPFAPAPPAQSEVPPPPSVPGWPPQPPHPAPYAPGPPIQPQVPPPPAIPGWPPQPPGQPWPGSLPGLPQLPWVPQYPPPMPRSRLEPLPPAPPAPIANPRDELPRPWSAASGSGQTLAAEYAHRAFSRTEPRASTGRPADSARQASHPEATFVYWLSRDIQVEGQQRGLHVFQHSEIVLANRNERYCLSSGPSSDGLNVASIVDHGATPDTTNLVGVAILPGGWSKDDLARLVSDWNGRSDRYSPLSNNCNTFSDWVWSQLGFKPLDLNWQYPH